MATQVDGGNQGQGQQNDSITEHSENKSSDLNGLPEQMNGLNITDGSEETEGNKNSHQKDEHDNLIGKGNEEKKIFCGGISYDTNMEDLVTYFSQYGIVKEAQVKYDRITGRSRGFAFVEFETVEACKASLIHREQTIKGKQCEIKPAKTREISYMNKKIFVGGLPGDFPEEELRKHFEQFGPLEDIEWPFDKQTKTRKNFAFVVFEDEDSADRAAANPKQNFASREVGCDIKKAVPQNKRMYPRGAIHVRGGGAFSNGPIGCGAGMRGMGGGNAAGSHHQQMPLYSNAAAAAAQWYQMNAAAWYNATYNGGAAWYGSPATGNAAASQWYNTGNNATSAQAQWYGMYNQQGGNNAGDQNGTA